MTALLVLGNNLPDGPSADVKRIAHNLGLYRQEGPVSDLVHILANALVEADTVITISAFQLERKVRLTV